ncbi:MAG: hypothetical protein E3J72_10715 [Planctomycetota bacterium]|nr:MAG: hypothetical protein E3J72_10715 [Planctomycetota bacterium]
MKTCLLTIGIAAVLVFAMTANADDKVKIKYYVIKATESGSIPKELKFLKKKIEAKGYKGAELIKSDTGEGTVEVKTHGYKITMKFSGNKVRLILKKGEETIFDGSVTVKKKPYNIWGPEVDGGQLLFIFKKA